MTTQWRRSQIDTNAATRFHRARHCLGLNNPFVIRVSLAIIAAGSFLGTLPTVSAQGQPFPPRSNYLFDAQQPPGYVAGAQSMKRPSSYGTFQAVSISGPGQTKVALAKDGQFLPPLENPVATAMMVGAVYRVRVTNIPFRPGQELYPTIEVLDRLYAPPGREHRFPIPIVLTEEDLRLAIAGALVTRVIYLEDSETASPLATPEGEQITTNVLPSDNALKVADQLGKPVAILRIGSRVPANLQGDLSHFVFGSPPWIPLPTVPDKADFINSGRWMESIPSEPTLEPNSERPGQDFPRLPAATPSFVP